jgi:heme O synthase-like polyprenyltransferase
MLVLGLSLLALSLAAGRGVELGKAEARRVFLASLAYHPVFLLLLLIDTVRI